MCGIVGFVRRGDALPVQESEQVLRLMADTVRHRGPDGEGYLVAGPAALGHRRLSIIDLATGAQPMLNEDGTVAVIFNGEIYNFLELRPKLEKAGHVFRTQSDTEVIIHAYEEYGTECLQHFNGMFAFALWDAKKRRLFAARDRMGKKPLYYALRGDTLVFGSELTALLKHPLVKPIVTPYTVSRYLAFGYVPAPDTIYDQIHKLLPAQMLTFEEGKLNLETYWKLDFERHDFSGVPEAELRRRFWELFRDAVRLRLVSDVPLGVFLSGGIDSSAIVAMMCELMPPKDVKTFTIGFKEKRYDESDSARAVARHFGTDHHEKILDPALMLERLPALIARMDEPLADPSLSPTSLVSEFARSQITVALGGDGGDELFAGYGTFWLDRMAGAYARLPRGIRRSVESPSRALFDAARLRRLRRAVEYIGGAADAPEPWRVMMWSEAAIPPAAQFGILASPNPEILRAETLYADTISHEARAPRRSRLARLQYQFQKQYLPDDILTKVDRASMMYGLEVRAPLLDTRIVDFANALPDRFKLRGRQGKGFFRRALEGKLPDGILDRPKMGFGIPLAEWLRSALRPQMAHALAPKFLEEQGIFRADALSRLWAEHVSGHRNHRGILWTVLALQLWWEEHKLSFSREIPPQPR
jgi:asparagine synthase (glutamine-hydrolysing)